MADGETSKQSITTIIINAVKARWIGYPLIVILFVVADLIQKLPLPDRFFLERDPDLSNPYKTDTFPSWALAFTGGIGPIIIIIFAQIMAIKYPRNNSFPNRVKDIHLVTLVLGETLGVALLVTNIIKSWIGRLRPDFFAWCNYKGYSAAINSGNFTDYLLDTVPGQLGDYQYCEYDIPDSRYSFPSGHSSVSFCGLAFLSLFLLHIISGVKFRHHNMEKAIRFLIIFIPLFSAALVAASRVVDYKHHVDDTIWGALIGGTAAYLAFASSYGHPQMMSTANKENQFIMAPSSNQIGADEAEDVEVGKQM